LVEKLQDQFLGGGSGGVGEGGLVEMRYRCVLEQLRAECRRQKARKIGVVGEVAMGNMEIAAWVTRSRHGGPSSGLIWMLGRIRING